MKHLQYYKLFEKKSKRKIGKWAKWCMNLGYAGVKNNKCYGKKKKPGTFTELDWDKDYYYDAKSNI